jgi:hypothetical protein
MIIPILLFPLLDWHEQFGDVGLAPSGAQA